ncbi:hypothetical protein [Geopseudomonas aromaticivorans]
MSQQPDILLDADASAVALGKIKDVQFALATIAEPIKAGQPLSHELARNVLRVSEYNIAEIGQKIGVETQTAADIEKRHADLRAANLRIRELEAQLGNAQAPEATQMSLRTLNDRLNAWWRKEGFGLVSETAFGPYGCKVTFSCHLFGDFTLIDSPTPVSDKERMAQWHDSLRQRGFMLVSASREVEIADCDASRKALCDLIMEHMPSARVISIGNHSHRGQGFTVRNMEVFIRKLEDILELPVPSEALQV